MTTAAKSNKLNYATPGPSTGKHSFDPDSFRMTIGEHLEELRTRMILGLSGFAVAAVVCFIFGEKVVWYFCKPLMTALHANGFSPQVYMTEVSESFMVFVKISMITAAAFASPWMVYQFWLFVAAGLYPHERKYITKYLPLSITLLISGMVFLYFVVLPLMLKFFVAFNIGLPIPFPTQIDTNAPQGTSVMMPILNGDPAHPTPGMFWYDASQGRLKFAIGTPEAPEIRVIPYGSAGMVSPHITLEAYIDMVLGMLLSFGVAFQTPLVVLTLVRIGIFEVEQLKAMRRYVYFSTAIIAGFIVPDVVGGMIALMIPLMLLFEMGLWLAREPGQSTGLGPWVARRWAHLKQTVRTRGIGKSAQKPLTWVGTILLIALLFHAMSRSRNGNPANNPAATPAGPATQPASQPASPMTRPVAPTSAPSTSPSPLPSTGPSSSAVFTLA